MTDEFFFCYSGSMSEEQVIAAFTKRHGEPPTRLEKSVYPTLIGKREWAYWKAFKNENPIVEEERSLE